jgi:dTDP-4-amino-4,6-dideoxygalactose transaminase
MFVGGEFYYDSRWQMEKRVVPTGASVFLNGGQACLIVISDYLLDHGIDQILLPAYICPTVVTTLEKCGMTCEYYQVNPELDIDLDDLVQKVTGHQAVYFINYFGFFQPAPVREMLAGLQKKGLIVVEDNAQAGFATEKTGDFVFNSLRKLAPYDGGYLTTKLDVSPYIMKRRGNPNHRLPLIREYRQRLVDYLFNGDEIHEKLVELYRLAEESYETDFVVEGDPQEQWAIEHLDWSGIRQLRRENYTYLLDSILNIPGITPIFPQLQADNMPMGLPVYLTGVSRDWLFDELGAAGVGLTVHWDEILRDSRLNQNPVAVDMANRMITLVIDQRTSHKQLDYLTRMLKKLLV